MKLVVGLGNPGRTYEHTRHNVGFLALDALARKVFRLSWEKSPEAFWACSKKEGVVLAKPLTFVNRSGHAVSLLYKAHTIQDIRDLLVIVDDVELPLGHLRLRCRGSDGGHRGLRSITESLGTSRFARLRLGIARPSSRSLDLAAYVLTPFSPQEKSQVEEMIQKATRLVCMWVGVGYDAALKEYSQMSQPRFS